MSEIVKELLKLAEIDHSIIRGKNKIDELVKKVQAIQLEKEKIKQNIKKLELEIKNQILKADKVNMDVKVHASELDQQENKIKSVKNQKEYKIITDRIKELKINIDQGESSILKDMEELDKLRKSMSDDQQELLQIEEKLQQAKQQAQEEKQHIVTNHHQKITERDEVIKNIKQKDEEAYKTYDQALKRTKGDAIAEMSSDGVCQTCFRRQNMNVLNIVAIGKEVKNSLCQGCGRILFIKKIDGIN